MHCQYLLDSGNFSLSKYKLLKRKEVKRLMNISTDFFNSNLGDNTLTGVAKGTGLLSVANATNMTGSIQGGFHKILQGAFQGNEAKNQKTEGLQTQRKEVFVPRGSENSFERAGSSARRSDSNIQSDKRPVESNLIKDKGKKVEVPNKKNLKASSELDLENNKEGYEAEDVAKNFLNVIALLLNLKPEEVEELVETSGIQLEDVLEKIHSDKLTKILNKLQDSIATGDMNEEKEGVEWSAIQDLLIKVAEGEENSHPMTKTRQNIQEIKDYLLEPLQEDQEMIENKQDQFSASLNKSKEDDVLAKDIEVFAEETSLDKDGATVNEQYTQELAEKRISPENLGQTSLEVFSEIMPVDAKSEMDGKDLSSNINNQQSQKLQDVTGVTKVTKNEQVFKESIFDQILGKAKVTLAKGKSEMELELKPESLGKLTLKIVTEKGSVVAKVIAENHQVKQLLELSMNELKESLESQGIKLEGFQVDVEQKKENEPRKQEEDGAKEDQKNSRNITKRTVIKSIQNLYTSYNDENDMASGYYVGQEKSINLTA
jgi:flagellar hook-length control protein FliK